ncbi:MAG: MgtC/SapB family protein, partial [Gammaproteobacteria bacterium]
MITTDLFTKIQPFAISLALGLLIGIERERSHPVGYQPLGLRTFILFSLLGTIAACVHQPLVSLAFTLFVGGVVIAGYLYSSRKTDPNPDIGMTTEVAAVVTYGLGYLAFTEPFIALILGVIVLVVLFARTKLHKFSRTQLKAEELQAAVILLVLGLGVIPFLPNKAIDPWFLINPQRFGLLILTIVVLQFLAYLGIRLFGPAKGILVSGFLAGFVSSTAATATISQQAKTGSITPLTAAAAIGLTTVGMFVKLLIILLIVSPKLLSIIGIPVVATCTVMLITAYFLDKYIERTDHFPTPSNPIALWSAIKLAVLLGSMLIIVTLAEKHLGELGIQAVVFLGGLFEVHGASLGIANLFQHKQITMTQAFNSISLGIFASFISKY